MIFVPGCPTPVPPLSHLLSHLYYLIISLLYHLSHLNIYITRLHAHTRARTHTGIDKNGWDRWDRWYRTNIINNFLFQGLKNEH